MSPDHRPPVGWRRQAALTLTEAAAVAGISRSRFYELAAEGRVPTITDPHRRQRVRVPGLLAFMASEGITPADEPEPEQPDLFTEPGPTSRPNAPQINASADDLTAHSAVQPLDPAQGLALVRDALQRAHEGRA